MGNFFKFKHKGNFNNAERFFNRILRRDYLNILEHYGQEGVNVLKAATPVDSGETAESWGFEIEEHRGVVTIAWTNHNENDGVNIALMIIYGHGLQNGAYIDGIDFVNPVMRPLMRDLAKRAWKGVTK